MKNESKLVLSIQEVDRLALDLSRKLLTHVPVTGRLKVYGIPRGGLMAAFAIRAHMGIQVVDHPAEADVFVDDIIDSGATMAKLCDEFPGIPFFALIDKTNLQEAHSSRWVVFPWEVNESGGIEDNIRRLIQFVGDNPEREGLEETPRRVAKAWEFWCSGYSKKPEDVLKVFEDGAESCDEMVVVKDIPFYTHCEHHMAPFFGTATIAYIPNGKIVGLSKLSRLLDMFARRLQVQERLTNQVADALFKHLEPKGVAVQIKARHMCMESRGTCQQGHHTITNALRGVIKDDAKARSEFMEIAK